jgi:hypothetical protein
MTTSRRCAIAAAVIAAIVSARPETAAAQTRRTWDVSGGYAFVRDATEDVSLPRGWTAGASLGVNRWLSIAVDAGGSYRTVELVAADVRIASHTVMIGGRAAVRIGKVVEFGQILVGPVRTRGTAFGSASVDTHVAAQAGAGFDVPLRDRWAARVEFDTRVLRTGHEFRTVAVLVYRAR